MTELPSASMRLAQRQRPDRTSVMVQRWEHLAFLHWRYDPEVLQPTNPLVMWAFSDLSDKRWRYTQKYLVLKQDPKQRSPQKLGLFNPKTWGAYLWRDTLFLKQYAAEAGRCQGSYG